MLGHELRNPLGVIRTALELLRNCDEPQASTRQVTRIDHQIAHLSRMVDDLLDLSRVSRGRILLRRQPCELGAVAAAALEDSGAAGQGRSVELHRSEEPLWVDGDSVRLEQVVTNLVGNAIKFGKGKPIDVEVSVIDGWAELAVQDHGIGIAPDRQVLIFERFQRAVSSRHFAGLGLGLYITRQIVEAHGGGLRLTSAPGEGSRFVVCLPLRAPTEPIA
jgi:signal transduction histidine kinase